MPSGPAQGAPAPAGGPAPGGYSPSGTAPGGYSPGVEPTSQFPSVGAPVAKRSRATAILATLMVLLFLALAGMTAVFLVNRNSSDKKIADQKSQIGTLQRDLKAKSDELTKTNQDLNTAKSDAAAAKKQADSADACIKAVQDFFKAAKANDEAAGGRALLAINRDCEGVEIS
jgi:septal ring factor EnvC (AmiA/AmiB activator)